MQGVVFDIKRFAVHDGPGIRTTVFFKGCPLRCYWCHNPESWDDMPVELIRSVKIEDKTYTCKKITGRILTIEEVMEVITRDWIFMDESGGGVTFSGGEPTAQPQFLLGLLNACARKSIHTAVDTSGFCEKKILEQILPVTGLFLFDLKHADPDKHIDYTGFSNKLILDNLKFLIECKKTIHIRIPVVPDFNFNDKDLEAMLDLLRPHKSSVAQINLLPYHSLAVNKYKKLGTEFKMNNFQSLKEKDLRIAKEMFEHAGFTVKIGG